MSEASSPYARRFPVRSSDPATGVDGQCYWNTSTNKLRIYDGSAWGDALPAGATISGLTTGQYVKAASATTIQTDGVKRYVALLTQSSTDAPVATVLENSLGGTVVWARSSTGSYTATLASAFPAAKTALLVGSIVPSAGQHGVPKFVRTSDNVLSLQTQDVSVGDTIDELADAMLSATTVTVYVYP